MPLHAVLFLAFLFVFGGANAYGQEEKIYDYVIKNVSVFDGEKFSSSAQDIAIAGERIVQFGKISEETAREVIQGEGWVASPGFIDLHAHSDFNPFVYPNWGNKVMQGVTTEVVGNCGMSAAPVKGPHKKEIGAVWRREGVPIPESISWESFSEYRYDIEYKGLDSNFAAFVGHGNLRSAVMGMEPRAATSSEIDSMRDLLKESMKDGAFGVSFGLVYLPGIFAAEEELVALCEEAGKRKGLCVFHIRSEGKALVEAIDEAIRIGKKAQASIHISHLKTAGEKNWPKIDEVFQKIEQAQKEGMKITADAYPYAASFAELGVVLPDELYKDPERLKKLKDPVQREKIRKDLEKHYQEREQSWERVWISAVMTEKNKAFQGKSLLDLSRALKKPEVDILLDILVEEEFQASAFFFSQNEEVVERVLSKPYVAVGSDSIADGSAVPHPRAYGTFVRLLARCQKAEDEETKACLKDRLHQMTGFPAGILDLKDRGKIAPGFFADLVLFNPTALKDQSNYNEPKNFPQGIEWVFVNGKPVVREGKYKAVHSGLLLASER